MVASRKARHRSAGSASRKGRHRVTAAIAFNKRADRSWHNPRVFAQEPEMTAPRILLSCWFVVAAASAQVPEPAELVRGLASPETRDAARKQLLGLGGAAATALVDCLGDASVEHGRECLAVLAELGPNGGPAVLPLARLLSGGHEMHANLLVDAWATLAELIPYRSEEIDEADLQRMIGERGLSAFDRSWSLVSGSEDSLALTVAMRRLRERHACPRALTLDELLVAARGRRAFAAEVAIERLGAMGPAAARALPLLRQVLARPEPRVLPGDQRIPLHRKAARALLAIAPDDTGAATARAALAGAWTPPARPGPEIPERASRRIAELLEELAAADPARSQAAADNLVALGSIAALPVAARLDPALGSVANATALGVLQRLGRHAAPAVPRITEALMTLSAEHTVAALRALVATAPWSEHVVLGLTAQCSIGHVSIAGRRIEGTIDVAFLNAFHHALQEFHLAMAVPVDGTSDQLRDMLADRLVARRRRALEVIAARGRECADLLDAVGAMLDAQQPAEHLSEWINAQSFGTRQVDRTEQIRRLAATAIVAIAPPEHALVATARTILAQPAAK
jgi:hypothetical protein